ncbi:MAG TPA: DUF1801 domain-containing protein [Bacteroidia bacterium]|jgi:uncharacterized protein YdhG (YjbR/CyaY superfamily)|nr:DUF1801 domain-containing protein [Bacteroidia bacterium]
MTKKKKEELTVDKYIASYPEKVQLRLKKLRQTIKKAAPDAEEIISYSMPAYKYYGMLVYFAAHTNHYGIYGMPKVMEAFKTKLKAYKTSKATLQFTFDKPLPVKLVTELVKAGAKHNLEKALLKKAAKKK